MDVRNRIAAAAACFAFSLAPALSSAATTVHVEGSTNPSAAVTKAAEAFNASHPAIVVSVKGSSSGAGIAALRAGTIDAALSDVSDADPQFVDHVIGTLGIAIVADPKCGVKNITRKQMIAIYSGKITNWKQLGGADLAIVPLSRPIGTGTRFVFEKLVAKTLIQTREPKNAPDVGGIVAKTPGAIAYVGTSFTDPAHDYELSYNGIAPTPANIRSHRYTFATDEHIFTKKNGSKEAAAFANFAMSDRALMAKFGMF